MKIVNTNKLNRFWQKGIKPIIELLGKSDITEIGDGTVTGALDALSGRIDVLSAKIGDDDAAGTSDLLNKINELSEKIDVINAALPYKITFSGTTMNVADDKRS